MDALADAVTDRLEEIADEPCVVCGEDGDTMPCVACDRLVCGECGVETRWCAECWDKRQETL